MADISILNDAATVMDGEALKQAIHLSDACIFLACACVVGAVISMFIVVFAKTPNDVASAATAATKTLSAHQNLAPVPIDISKVLDAAKGIIEALTKAGPLLVWMTAAVFFMAIAMFGVSNTAQNHTDHGICFETSVKGQNANDPTPTIKCVKSAEERPPQNTGASGGSANGGNTPEQPHPDQQKPKGTQKPKV